MQQGGLADLAEGPAQTEQAAALAYFLLEQQLDQLPTRHDHLDTPLKERPNSAGPIPKPALHLQIKSDRVASIIRKDNPAGGIATHGLDNSIDPVYALHCEGQRAGGEG